MNDNIPIGKNVVENFGKKEHEADICRILSNGNFIKKKISLIKKKCVLLENFSWNPYNYYSVNTFLSL